MSTTMISALVALLLMSGSTTPSGQPTPKQPADYTPARQSKVVSWQLQRVLPPSPVYVGIADVLVVAAASSQTNEVVTVNYRLLRAADGAIVPGQLTVAPANTRAVKVQTLQLAEGFLLSVSVKAAVATTRGMTFVRAFLGAGPFGAGQPSYMLLADYVTTAMAPAHPNGRVLAPSEGPGNVVILPITNPGNGVEWSLTVPTNARWRLVSAFWILSSDATVGNRVSGLRIKNAGGNLVWNIDQVGASIPASSSAQISATAGVNGAAFSATGFVPAWIIPLPTQQILLATGVIQSLSTFLGANDSVNTITVQVEEWLDNV
jgi:hypothetical protein